MKKKKCLISITPQRNTFQIQERTLIEWWRVTGMKSRGRAVLLFWLLQESWGSLFQIDMLVFNYFDNWWMMLLFCNTRSGFQNSSISLAQLPNKVILTVGEGIPSLSYDLSEAKAIEKKTELQLILFKLADKVAELTQELKGKWIYY